MMRKEKIMAELILMEKAGEHMNVPDAKLQAYLDDGWREVSRTVMSDQPAKAKKVKVPQVNTSKKASKQGGKTAAAAEPEVSSEEGEGEED